jgi:hypothetical protein
MTEPFIFTCGCCGVAVSYEYLGECDGPKAAWAAECEAREELRERGWRVSYRCGTRCADCNRRSNKNLLDRPLGGAA